MCHKTNIVTIHKITKEQTWPIRHRVMWPNKPLDYIKLPEDHTGLHYGLFVNKDLVSIVSVFINGQDAQFRKFATLKQVQSLGYGATLLNFMFQELASLNMKRIWCNARINKTHFYKRFGMLKTKNIFNKSGIDYVIMTLSPSPLEPLVNDEI